MSSNEEQVSLENVIGRVQKKLENGCSDEKKYKYLKHLGNLHVDVHILRKTGIGKIINGYRKEEGQIGKKATELIIKWKNIAENYSKQQDKVNKDKRLQQGGISDMQKYKQKNEQPKTHDSTSISAKHQIPHKDIKNIIVSHEKITAIPCQRIPQKDIRNIVMDTNTNTPLSSHSSLALKNEKLSKKIDENSFSRLRDNSSNQHSETNTSLKNKYSKPTDDFTSKRKKQEGIGGENDDSDPEDEEKYKNASFADMLMMPMLNLKKKKKIKKDSPLKKAKISKMPSLPEIQLPDLATPEPVYTPTVRPPNPPLKSESEKKKSRDTPSMYVEIVSRKTRSHMYSGKKQSTGTVVSLYQQCMRVLIENVDSLYDTGGVPYEILKPLLAKCSPYHLERLEECNPHFLEDTDILWKAHCQREFKGHQPDEMETWRELFKRLGEEREARLHKLSEKITSHQAAKVPERSVKLAYVSTGPKPSPQVLRKQKKHGTGKDIISERKKELKEKLESDSRDTAVAVPFTNVPRRDRCIKRPPSSLTHGGSFHLQEPKKKKKEGLGSSGPSHLMPTQRKPGKKPMMAAALKSLKNMKGRMASQIVRK